ncbi:hypothetical protein Tco_0973241 [Tanacetum coccineum]
MAEDDKEKTRFYKEEGVYCFTHMPKELKNSTATLQRMMEKVLADQRGRNMEIYLEEIVIKSKKEQDLVQGVEEILRKLKRVYIKIDPIMSSFGVKEGRFLGQMVTREGKDLVGRTKPKNPSKDKKEIEQIANIGYSKGRRSYDAMSTICYTPTEKMVQGLIHTTRSLRAIFRKHKVKVVTDEPMEIILKLSGREGRLAKWATKVQTYDISCIQRKEAEGSVAKKFFGQGEQVQETPDANEREAFNLSRKLQAK